MNKYTFIYSMLARLRYHKLTKEGVIITIAATAVVVLIVFAYKAAKKSKLYKSMGFSSAAEYKAYKSSCKYNFRNRFCISDEWVINEFSYKYYPSGDVLSVSSGDSPLNNSSSNIRLLRITIQYRGGTDTFNVTAEDGSSQLIRMIEDHIKSINA